MTAVRGFLHSVKLPLFGLLFLAVVAGLLGLTVAVYNKAFVDVVPVTLEAERAGTQLAPGGDVKLRGLIVGEIREVRSDRGKAVLSLALQPEDAQLVPANVRARLLPKTLFGEKYVALVIPNDEPPAPPIRAGAVIPQDRSRAAIETGQVLDNLLPLLRTLQPAKVKTTLDAMATALEGRGEALGDNLARAGRYFRDFNPNLPTLQQDISGLADLASNYADASPDLLRFFRAQAVTMQTFAEERDVFASFLDGTRGFADTGTRVIGDNSDRLIRLAEVSRPMLEVYAKYSPEFPCLITALAQYEPRLNETLGKQGPFLHITLELVPQREGYENPEDLPRYTRDEGPRCYELPQPGERAYKGAPRYEAVDDVSAADVGEAGSQREKNAVALAVAPVLGRPVDDVPEINTLLVAPMMRGMAVSLR